MPGSLVSSYPQPDPDRYETLISENDYKDLIDTFINKNGLKQGY